MHTCPTRDRFSRESMDSSFLHLIAGFVNLCLYRIGLRDEVSQSAPLRNLGGKILAQLCIDDDAHVPANYRLIGKYIPSGSGC